jgi:hypothetical protein
MLFLNCVLSIVEMGNDTFWNVMMIIPLMVMDAPEIAEFSLGTHAEVVHLTHLTTVSSTSHHK